MSGDAVLFWDLGGALQSEKVAQVEQLAKIVRQVDPAGLAVSIFGMGSTGMNRKTWS